MSGVHIMGDSHPNGLRLKLWRKVSNEWIAHMRFADETTDQFDISMTIDSEDYDPTADDGADQWLVGMKVGGLNDTSASAGTTRVSRCMTESELRWLAKMCLAAANECKRLENASRRKLKKKGGAA